MGQVFAVQVCWGVFALSLRWAIQTGKPLPALIAGNTGCLAVFSLATYMVARVAASQ